MFLSWINGHDVHLADLVNFIPVLTTIVTTVLSLVLARATLRYTKTTDKSLELAREQFEREWAPELHVRLEKVSATEARIIITNLAKTSVLLQLVQLRNISHALPFEKMHLNDPLVGGTTWTQPIADRLLKITGEDFQGSLNACVSFYASGRLYRSDWFRFKVEVRNNTFVRLQPVTIAAHRATVMDTPRSGRDRRQMAKDVVKEPKVPVEVVDVDEMADLQVSDT
jgi:hypothetical protein